MFYDLVVLWFVIPSRDTFRSRVTCKHRQPRLADCLTPTQFWTGIKQSVCLGCLCLHVTLDLLCLPHGQPSAHRMYTTQVMTAFTKVAHVFGWWTDDSIVSLCILRSHLKIVWKLRREIMNKFAGKSNISRSIMPNWSFINLPICREIEFGPSTEFEPLAESLENQRFFSALSSHSWQVCLATLKYLTHQTFCHRL